MADRLSYEPSAQTVFRDVLPQGALVLSDTERNRRRITWPVLAKATGLGEIEGGEIVLVPGPRADFILSQVNALADAGVAALVIGRPLSGDDEAGLRDANMALATVSESVDMKRLREDMERSIVRRRRDLYAFAQDLQRSLIEGAMSGAGIRDILSLAADRFGSTLIFDREGDISHAMGDAREPDEAVLVQARVACRGRPEKPVLVLGDAPALATPVLGGRERKGILVVLDVDLLRLDDLETLIVWASSACAIALLREPVLVMPTLSDLLDVRNTDGAALRDESGEWIAAAFMDDLSDDGRLERAVAAEFRGRGLDVVLARDGNAAIALSSPTDSFPWDVLFKSLARRLGSSQLKAGTSRRQRGSTGVKRAVEQALQALERGESQFTAYPDIELSVLLEKVDGWREFVAAQLGPLLVDEPRYHELLHTLRVYLDVRSNATEAARQLQVHRNTLIYRLRRLKALLGVDLEIGTDVFSLELAVRLYYTHVESATGVFDID